MHEARCGAGGKFPRVGAVCSCTDGGWVTSLVLPLSGNEQDFRAMESI